MLNEEMAAKGESVQTYVPKKTKQKLEDWAKEEQRSISFLVAQIIEKAIAERAAKAKGEGGRSD